MADLNVNSIGDASGGNTATINGYTPTVSNMAGRNRIINGDMRIDQRNAGASVSTTTTGNSVYTVDRWAYIVSQASKFTVQQNAGSVTPPVGFTNYLGITSTSAYSLTSTDYFGVYQPIEGFNTADLGWGTANAKTITVSFWVRSSLTGTFGASIRNGSFDRSYPFSYTIESANTWEQKSVTIAGDTTGTWSTTNDKSILLMFALGYGATYSRTSGAWVDGNYGGTTGATSVVGTSGATFYITGVQLEAGSVATPFEHRMYGQELALCQRYYQISENFIGSAGNTTSFTGNINFIVTMRGSPTVAQTAVLAITDVANADFTQSSGNISITAGTRVTSNAVSITAGNFTGLTTNRPLISIPSTTGKVALSAEL